ncbi:hypothetical protein GXP67_02740 [Rhodocytophaga rosea]|uniref:Uncharacterized protein n=1 Tax=Rhodocytophaga rosea TaxID=2704465 RepID=A0A6C0GCN5_9BACT|nr:hypothetical protein [Rhodocytophaga rosea]QHT65657.1 hypothetical protein GXP67_02740 [Rhodocytophaga rosea]
MKKSWILYVILFGIGMLGCKPTQHSIVGLYKSYTHFEISSKIQLYQNQRFQFEAQQGIVFLGGKGEWRLEGKHLILNSDTVVKDSSYIEFTNPIHNDSLTILVCYELETAPLSGAKVNVKNKQEWLQLKTDSNGRIKLPNQFIDSLTVSNFAMLTLNKSLGLKPTQHIRVVMMEDNLGSVRFKNEKWKIKRRRLIETIDNQRIVYKKRNK